MTTLAFLRPARRLDDSVKEAEAMGFTVLASSSMEIVPGSAEDFDAAGEMLLNGGADITVMSSPTAVEECVRAWGAETPKTLSGTYLVAMGAGTAGSLRRNGIRLDGIPEVYSSQGVADLLSGRSEGKKVLLIRSDKGSDVMRSELEAGGAAVTTLTAYRLLGTGLSDGSRRIAEEGIAGNIDVFAFTSPLSAESFFDSAADDGYDQDRMINNAYIAAIGGPTESLLRSRGIDVHIVPKKATFSSLLEAVDEFIKKGIE